MYMLETVEAQTTQAVEQKVALIREMSSSGRLVYVVDP